MSGESLARRSLLAATAGLAVAACAKTAPSNGSSPTSSGGAASSTATSSTSASTSTASASSSNPAESSATPTPTMQSCLSQAQALPIETRAGQLLMGSVDQPVVDQSVIEIFGRWQLGSVVVLGNRITSASAMTALSAQLVATAGDLPLVIAVDQEGGQIQRLKGSGYSDMPSAVTQAKESPAQLTANWKTWATELSVSGVLWNLAPCADVVPESKLSSNAPVGQLRRNYGTTGKAASPSVVAAIKGMHEAGVATSVKHFPGLGEVVTNTDFGEATDTITTADSESLSSFVAAIEAGTDSVMVSSAVYTRIDPDHRAAFSSKVITDLLRTQLGWQGLVISDDLGAAAAVADVKPADRATQFVAAGGDVVICANLEALPQMIEALVAKAEAEPDFAQRVTESAARVVALKAKLGLLPSTCG